MPDDRLFHKRLGHSQKVASLNDFEDRVWRAYILSADDFGVMRFSAVTLQADHDYLATRPIKTVMRALERVQTVALVNTFEHQNRTYCYSVEWQNYQRVKHPRQTINPKPSDDLLAQCSHATRQLFTFWPGKRKELEEQSETKSASTLRQDFPNPSAILGHLAGAGTRETAHANGKRLTADGERLAWFRDRYSELHREWLHGVDYIGNPQADYAECQGFVPKFTDDELEKLMVYWFNTRDKFTEGTRSIAKFRSRISGMQQELQVKGLWTATSAPAKGLSR
jgi:hypothetical protein